MPPVPDQTTQTTLHQQLQQELTLTQSLRSCLGDERAALENGDTEKLVQCANEKGALVKQLESCSQQWNSLLQRQGLPASKEGVQQLLSDCNNPTLQQAWDDLSTAAAHCREENRQLGMLIQREQGNVRQAQHILQRGTPASNHSYDASGQTDSNNKSRNLAKA